ncbi:WD40 repeat domain-containing protein [Nonomuraea zeae]|uniref:WD40 repeat domain-containing protein n=1 Tax=Nonomuraea zeae TaxID=1642303 RepID=A0A5S4F0I7_9ACTN|nr:PD40 domain-containing protein [Nonomuraea zeae]TMR09561.1 hypothetical protein ETD85_61315 [Nonomuraea zeae]
MIVNLGATVALTAMLGAAPAQPAPGPLPGTSARIVTKMAGRPIQFTSYATPDTSPPFRQRAWDPAKRAFVKTDATAVAVSPDGRWAASQAEGRGGGVPKVTLLDRKTGDRTVVELPSPADPEQANGYLNTIWPTWSPDGRTLLFNVFEAGFEPRSEGIVLVDVPAMKARFVRIENALITVGGFQWTRDSKGVVVRWGKNGESSIRQYDLTGAVKRTWHVRGRPASQGQGTFSPSGRRFVTACMSLEKSACVWDTATGKAVTRIKLGFSPVWSPVLGWYDERHLLAPVPQGIGIVDLKGKVVETLVKVPKKQGLYARFEARGNG